MRDTDRKREHLHDWPLQFELVAWTAEALEFEIEVLKAINVCSSSRYDFYIKDGRQYVKSSLP